MSGPYTISNIQTPAGLVERTPAGMRLWFMVFVVSYLLIIESMMPDAISSASRTFGLVAAMGGYALLADFWMARLANDSPLGIVAGLCIIALDTVMIGVMMHLTGDYGAVFWLGFPLVIAATSWRFGATHEWFAAACAVVVFSVVATYTPWWQSNAAASAGFLIALLFFPFSIHSIMERVREDNRHLHREVGRYALLAETDILTGLPNRRWLDMAIEQEIAAGRSFALLYADLNGFKPVNDLYGHDIGDEVLVAVAERLRKAVRQDDLVARVGGDEFIILLKNMTDSDIARHYDLRIKKVLQDPFAISIGFVEIGTAIGIGVYPNDGESVSALVRKADLRMYEDKKRQSDLETRQEQQRA